MECVGRNVHAIELLQRGEVDISSGSYPEDRQFESARCYQIDEKFVTHGLRTIVPPSVLMINTIRKRTIDMWEDKELLSQLCKDSFTYSQVCEQLGLNPPGSIRTLKKYIKLYEINVTHFDSRYHKRNGTSRYSSLDEILVKDSTCKSTWALKNRLIRHSVITEICVLCGQLPFHNGQLLKLQLDHINGDNKDNRLINLRMLCPNCHTQTDTFAGKNKQQMSVKGTRKIFLNKICKECKQQYLSYRQDQTFCSPICVNLSRNNHWNGVDLFKLIEEDGMSYEAVGRQLGLTGAAVKRQYIKNKDLSTG